MCLSLLNDCLAVVMVLKIMELEFLIRLWTIHLIIHTLVGKADYNTFVSVSNLIVVFILDAIVTD